MFRNGRQELWLTTAEFDDSLGVPWSRWLVLIFRRKFASMTYNEDLIVWQKARRNVYLFGCYGTFDVVSRLFAFFFLFSFLFIQRCREATFHKTHLHWFFPPVRISRSINSARVTITGEKRRRKREARLSPRNTKAFGRIYKKFSCICALYTTFRSFVDVVTNHQRYHIIYNYAIMSAKFEINLQA